MTSSAANKKLSFLIGNQAEHKKAVTLTTFGRHPLRAELAHLFTIGMRNSLQSSMQSTNTYPARACACRPSTPPLGHDAIGDMLQASYYGLARQ